MSSVTPGQWQKRPEAQRDPREVEVVSWGDLYDQYIYHLDRAERNYVHALTWLRAGAPAGFRLLVRKGIKHKLAAMALYELYFERHEVQRCRPGTCGWRLSNEPGPSFWGTTRLIQDARGV